MGHEIVYCSGCQSRLRGPDFEKGLAFHSDEGSWCATCAPSQVRVQAPAMPPITPRRGSRTARFQAAQGNRTALLFVGGGALVVGVILLAVAAGSGSQPPPPAPSEPREAKRVEKAPKPAPPAPSPKPLPAPNLEAVVRDLENLLVGGAPPMILLLKCEETAPQLRGTAYETRWRAVETEARKRRAAEGEKKVDATLAEARKILASAFVREREAELRAMLKAALGVSETRRADVERALADLDRALAARRDGLEVVRIYLVDMKTGKPVPGYDPFPDGTTLDAKTIGEALDIRAEVRGPEGRSVRFEITGVPARVEGTDPYDAGGTQAGPRAWATPGPKTLVVTPFPQKAAAGTPGKAVTLRFTVKP